eukprot:981104_1
MVERAWLPKDPRPIHYDLSIAHGLNKFDGHVRISLECVAPTSSITFNASDLNFESICIHDGLGKSMEIAPTALNHNKFDQTCRIDLHSPVSGRCVLDVKYSAQIRTDLKGFYRCTLRESPPDLPTPFWVTQMCPCDARRVLPCWDQPNMKATFTVSIETDVCNEVISNMPVSSTVCVNESRKRVTFKTSPKMPIYLLAWAIGKFEFLETSIPPPAESPSSQERSISADNIHFSSNNTQRCQSSMSRNRISSSSIQSSRNFYSNQAPIRTFQSRKNGFSNLDNSDCRRQCMGESMDIQRRPVDESKQSLARQVDVSRQSAVGECNVDMVHRSDSNIMDVSNPAMSRQMGISNQTMSGYMDISNQSRSGQMDLSDQTMSGQVDMPTQSRSGQMDMSTQSRSGQMDISNQSFSGQIKSNINILNQSEPRHIDQPVARPINHPISGHSAILNQPELSTSMQTVFDNPDASSCSGSKSADSSVNSHRSLPIRLRVYLPVGMREQGYFCLEVAERALRLYEEYFAIPYPLPKLD